MIVLWSWILRAVELWINSGEKLDNPHWNNLSWILNKVDINSSNLKINWKLAANWKICDTNNNYIWECDNWYIWDTTTNNCKAEWNKFWPHWAFPDWTIVSSTWRRSVSCWDSAVLNACESSCQAMPEVNAWYCRDDDNWYPQYRWMCNCFKWNTKTLSNLSSSHNAWQIIRSAYKTN